MEAATAEMAFFGPCRPRRRWNCACSSPLPASRCPGALDERGLEPRGAFAQTGRTAVACAFVVAGAQPGPRDQVPRARETGHVEADLGHDHLRAEVADTGDRAQQADGGTKGLNRSGD